jgi:cardiolipin synthase
MLRSSRSDARPVRFVPDDRALRPHWREFADRAFSRAAGAPLIPGNQVRLLEDGRENYPRWLEAIRSARERVHFESYFFVDDETGHEFARALMAKAGEGVRVRLIFDWLGGMGRGSGRFWRMLRAGGVEVRAYNPPQISNPLGWISRDHRKLLLVDDEVAFVGGLCVGNMWVGNAGRRIEPWRDTGIEIRGPAIAEIATSFARMWSLAGEKLDSAASRTPAPTGDVRLRIVSSEPATAGLLRLDQMVAALARHRLWIADAYYAGTMAYVQALRAAASDGVDVRLLVPNATDLPIIRPLSRSGYRPLLEAGVRIFEWNGTMMHAKTAVADGRWARIGSTNLNVASWFGNCELDVVVEDEPFGHEMEQMYLRDLERSTEVVLDQRRRAWAPGEPRHPRVRGAGHAGSTRRATAGAIRVGRAIGAAILNRRVLGPVEARLAFWVGLALSALAIVVAIFPRVLAYPVALLALWGGIALLWRSRELRRQHRASRPAAARERTTRA